MTVKDVKRFDLGKIIEKLYLFPCYFSY